ncbi:MAG: hypothetical protein ACI8W8_002712 [Rhodothermales bacterium]|jgi:uncharacterized protein (UPF0261 family)
MATIAVLGTLDSKGEEHAFVADQLRTLGHTPLLIDVGTLAPPTVTPDITREEVATLPDSQDRGECVSFMAEAVPAFFKQLADSGRIQGVISLGGGGGTAICTAAMRALPVGFPKLMVSTLASGNTAHYVGSSDIVMMPSIVDVAGLNRISRTIFTRAAGAISGMVNVEVAESADQRPLIVASMFGNTTECIGMATKQLEAAGYEVLVFHATGMGGKTMEALISSGMVAGVLDVTTTEWADELVGGTLSAGPDRLDAAAAAGIPAVIAPGCLDMANFGGRETVPAEFADRLFYIHNPQVTLMRTTPAECAKLGQILAKKANAYPAPTTLLIPRQAISVIAAEGQPFYDPAADSALFDAIHAHAKVPVIDVDCGINDAEFATACVDALLANIAALS